MQAYLHHGWGFSGSHLTDAQAQHLARQREPREGEVGLRFVSFSETDGDVRASWGTVVALPLGEVGQRGKLLTGTHAAELLTQSLEASQREAIVQALQAAQMGELIAHLEMVFYLDHY